MKTKYNQAEIKIVLIQQDILTLSLGGTNSDPNWGGLSFGGEKNSPLAEIANSIAEHI